MSTDRTYQNVPERHPRAEPWYDQATGETVTHGLNTGLAHLGLLFVSFFCTTLLPPQHFSSTFHTNINTQLEQKCLLLETVKATLTRALEPTVRWDPGFRGETLVIVWTRDKTCWRWPGWMVNHIIMQGNHYCSRDYGTGSNGSGQGDAYHYSNS
jgi:hypothetical protein